jgi:(2Fe-2S) ferredoxin
MDDEVMNPGEEGKKHVLDMLENCMEPNDKGQGVFLYNDGVSLAMVTFNANTNDVFQMMISAARAIDQKIMEGIPSKEMLN